MNKSESIKEIGKALGAFHKIMRVVGKSETNPFFKSKYASLATILTAIKEPLDGAGLVFTQFPTGENEMTTTIIHPASGEWMSGTFKMTPSKNDPQGQGSVITYQRRYALGAILGLNIDEDDDGNQASTPAPKAVINTVKEVPEPKKRELMNLLKEIGVDPLKLQDRIMIAEEVRKLTGMLLHVENYTEIINRLKIKLSEKSSQ